MIYFVAIFISVLIAYFVPEQQCRNKKRKVLKVTISKKRCYRKVLIFCSIMPLMLLAVFRYGIGTDYFYTYVPQFRIIVSGGDTTTYEIGFYWFNKIIAHFTSNPQWPIAIVSIITLLIIYFFIYKESKDYAFSVFLFFWSYCYFISLNNSRQVLASAILLIAMAYLFNGKKIVFVALVVLASSFHQVSILFLLLLVGDFVNTSAWTYTAISFGMFGIGKIVAPKIVRVLSNYIPKLVLYQTASKLMVYNGKTFGTLYVIFQCCFMIMLLFMEQSCKGRINELNSREKLEWEITKLCQCLIVCVCAVDGLVPAAYRIERVFSFVQFILLPNAICNLKISKKNKMIYYTLIIIMFGIVFVQNWVGGNEGVVPYRSIFDQQ